MEHEQRARVTLTDVAAHLLARDVVRAFRQFRCQHAGDGAGLDCVVASRAGRTRSQAHCRPPPPPRARRTVRANPRRVTDSSRLMCPTVTRRPVDFLGARRPELAGAISGTPGGSPRVGSRMDPLSVFSPATRAWFERAFDAPTPAQMQGWPAIASGEHVLIQAPTGSGKTLTAFLSAIDRLNRHARRGAAAALRLAAEGVELRHRAQPARPARRPRVEVEGWRSDRRHAAEGAPRASEGAAGHPDHDARVALPDAHLAGARVAARRRDADPRRGARDCRQRSAVRISRCQSSACKRSSTRPIQRIGLSATQRPLEEIGRFVSRRAADRDRRCGDAEGARPRGGRAGRGHARARARRRRSRSPCRPTARRWTAAPSTARTRSGRRSIPRCCGSSRSTARRSSSSTTAAWPSGSRCG